MVRILAPQGIHLNNPIGWERQRNLTRTLGNYLVDSIGSVPQGIDYTGCILGDGIFGFDGEGTSTWRVESDFETNGFDQADPSFGFSDFFDVVVQDTDTIFAEFNSEKPYQWDTGQDVSGFVGDTPYSLDRGDVFNVRAGEVPIEPDSLENNDSFQQALDLGVLAGPDFSVNALETSGNLTIETKGDRDYYSFVAAASGPLSVDFTATDLLGDYVAVNVYEVDDTRDTEQQSLQLDNAGNVQAELAFAGTSRTYNGTVVAGRTYIVEVFSEEHSNVVESFFSGDDTLFLVGDDKPFFYGTVRSYDLSISTPSLPGGGGGGGGAADGGGNSGGGNTSGGGDSSGQNGSGNTGGGGGGSAPASQPGNPFVSDFVGLTEGETRNTAVGQVGIVFNEDVRGFDLADLSLTRDGEVIVLDELALDTITAEEYSIFLGDVTGTAGTYTFTVVAADSEILDLDDNTLPSDFSVSWTVETGVNGFTDGIDTDPGDGVYADVNGIATLRSAIMEANVSVGAESITLAAGVYNLGIDGHFEDEAFVGDLDVFGSLTIIGAGAQRTIINGNDLDRIFHVHPGALLILEGVTLMGGEAHDGGAIFNEGVLEIRDANFSDNFAFSQGGAIYNAGTLSLDRVGFAFNEAGSRGGAIYNNGNLNLLNTTVSTNNAASRGGGIHNDSFAEIINSTITLNDAGSRGGGVAAGGGSLAGRFSNTIVSANLATDFGGQVSQDFDVSGSVNSFGHNLIGMLDDDVDALQIGYLDTDIVGSVSTPVDALLANLTTAGGNRVFHHNLNSGSPAADGGLDSLYPNDLVTSLDVVGSPRLIDGTLDSSQTIDIGAVERFFNVPVARFTANPNPAGPNEVITFDGSISTHSNAPRGTILTHEWDFSYDATAGFNVEAEGEVVTNSYPTQGTVPVALRVTDDSDPAQVDIYIVDVEIGPARTPTVLSPNGITTDRTPVITWTDISGVFEIEIVDITTGRPEQVVLNISGLTDNVFDTEWIGQAPLEPGLYKVRVRSSNAAGTSDFSDFHEFEVRRISLLSPEGPLFDRTPIFEWDAIPGASRYDLWVNSNAPGFVSQIIRRQAIPGSETTFEPIQQLGVGEYTAWVRAFDADGLPGDWSVPVEFEISTVDILEPLTPTIDSTPPFVWTDLHTAVGADPIYDLWVNQVGVQSQFIREIVFDTQFVPTSNLPNGSYDMWVRPLSSTGEAGAWSQRHSFVVNTNLQPNLISPSGVIADRTPTFEWEAVNGAVEYTLWYRNITTGEAVRVPGLTDTTYTPTVDLGNGIYRWAIRALNEDGKGGVWSDQVEFNLASPTLINPVNPQVLRPTFEWLGFEEYVRYELWVNDDTSGQSRIIDERNLTETTFTPEIDLVAQHTYTAWVRAEDVNGFITRWSPAFTFTVDVEVPDAPILRTPNGVILTNFPTFTWDPVTAASSYEIIVKRIENTGQVTVINQTGIDPTVANGVVSWDSNRSLPVARYRWWVRAINANGDIGAYSQPIDFQIVSSDVEMPAESDQSPLPGDVLPESVDPEFLLVSATMQSTITPVTTVHQTTMPVTVHVTREVESETAAAETQLSQVSSDEAEAMDAVMSFLPESGLLFDTDEVVEDDMELLSEDQFAVETVEATGDDEIDGELTAASLIALAALRRRSKRRKN